MTKNEWVEQARDRIAVFEASIKWVASYSSREPDWTLIQLQGAEAERAKRFLEEGIRLMEA